MDVRVGDVLFLGRRALSTEVRDVACSMGSGRYIELVSEQGQLNLNWSELGVIRSGESG